MKHRTTSIKPIAGREAAARALAAALSGQGFAVDVLRELRAQQALTGREAGLATEIALGTLRHLHTIEHVLGRVGEFRRERVPVRLRSVLYAGVYQVIWLDRVPSFAAVNESVTLARRLVGQRASSLVNALLRRLTDAILVRRGPWERREPHRVRVSWDEACVFKAAVLPSPQDGADAYVAAAAGEMEQRYATLVARHGAELAERVAWASQGVPPTVLQRNSLRATPDVFVASLRNDFGAEVTFGVDGDAAFLPASAAVAESATLAHGLAYVQDVTARRAADAVAAQAGERVLDLCAAPGGKTLALAVAMRDRGRIVACDVESQRLGQVDANVARLGLAAVLTRRINDETPLLAPTDTPFDAALVDVPCSNSGVVARRPEARLGLTTKKLQSLAELQRRLLMRAVAVVRSGGRVVYSTCSIEPAENEERVQTFLKEHPAWQLEREQTTLPDWGPNWSDWCDGGYFAVLRHAAHTSDASPTT